jgi:hypothetical protein
MQQRSMPNARNNRSWHPAADPDEAARRASGRRRYNARRQVRAAIRRGRIISIWEERSRAGWSIFSRGSQTQLAEMLGVDRSTICRDVKAILSRQAVATCPICDSALRIDRLEELERQGRGKVIRLR